MQSHKNNIVIASAGSGKTTHIVNETLSSEERVAIVTYTQNNEREIKEKFQRKIGTIPNRATVVTWFRFLLSDWIRPYGNYIYPQRIENVNFHSKPSRYLKKANLNYYIDSDCQVYRDRTSQFAIMCNEQSRRRVEGRLRRLYEHIYIDEVQDLAGYDLELLKVLLKSDLKVTLVGDPRQATYRTNRSPKNSQYGGSEITDKFEEWNSDGLCNLEYLVHSHRCNQQICDFADLIYPDAPKTISKTEYSDGHDGMFLVGKHHVAEYLKEYPCTVELRHDKRVKTHREYAMNFGASKGLTFPRVLIYPFGALNKALESGDFTTLAPISAAKTYVAVTRARHSVAFMYDGEANVNGIQRWDPGS